MPTIAYLLRIDRSKFENTYMGRVLVNAERNAAITNYGEIMGTSKDTFKIADYIIKRIILSINSLKS